MSEKVDLFDGPEAEFPERLDKEIMRVVDKAGGVLNGESLPVVAFACLEMFARCAATCPPDLVGMVEEQVRGAMDALRAKWAEKHEGMVQ